MPGDTYSFRLTPQTAARLARVASERRITRTAAVELAIAQLADQTRPPVDRARIEEAIEALRAMKSAAGKAGIGV